RTDVLGPPVSGRRERPASERVGQDDRTDRERRWRLRRRRRSRWRRRRGRARILRRARVTRLLWILRLFGILSFFVVRFVGLPGFFRNVRVPRTFGGFRCIGIPRRRRLIGWRIRAWL